MLTIKEARAALEVALNARFIPPAQLYPAVLLANAHSHEWAAALPARYVQSGATICQIRLFTQAIRSKNDVPGIEAPAMNDGDVIFHTTTTGRVEWQIWPDGSVRIAVLRPRLAGRIVALGKNDAFVVSMIDGELHARHFAALRNCLRALLCETMANEIVDGAQAEYMAAERVRLENELRTRVIGPPEPGPVPGNLPPDSTL